MSRVSLIEAMQIILVLTTIKRSAWVPVKTGISIGILVVYGLFNRTPGKKRNNQIRQSYMLKIITLIS